jgi:hypothetical protein
MSPYVVLTREKTLDQGELDVYAKESHEQNTSRRC